jgi:hypothetical protein
MKKILFSLSLLCITCVGFSQSEAYTKGMKSMLQRFDNASNSAEAYQEAANGFMRIADAEKGEWLPKYYAANSLILQAMATEDKSKVDGILDEADNLLSKISESVQSDEVMCLQAFSKSARINVDPMTRGARYSGESAKYLGMAQSLNPNNPRVYFLQAQSAFYTPEQFGGGKKTAKVLFQKAQAAFESFKPANELMPNWGKEINQKMLAECDK